MKKTSVQKLLEGRLVGPNELVRVKETGNITEIMSMEKMNFKATIKKLNDDYYEILSTGEVKEFEHIENRTGDMRSIRESLQRLRDYINTNVKKPEYCRWVTLTYAENMTDSKKLLFDFQNFNKRLRKQYGHYEYITAAEPQGRGAWHLHVVLIFDGRAPYISNKDVADAWKQGFVKAKRLDDVDNVGAYLTAYLGDMDLEEAIKEIGIVQINEVNFQLKEIETFDDGGNKKKKSILKGARLHMYPPKFNLYRCSKGIQKPEIRRMSEAQAQKKVKADTLTFEKAVLITDEKTSYQNTITYRYYNSVRKKSNLKIE